MAEFDDTIQQIKEQLGFKPVYQLARYSDGTIKRDKNGKGISLYETNPNGSIRTDANGKPVKAIQEWRFINSVLLFAFNGTGKTRLSYEFAHQGRENGHHHTLYYNAFTEDLFTWHNDLDNDNMRYMVINTDSELIRGIDGVNYDTEINNYLSTLVGFKAHFETNYHDKDGNIIVSGESYPREVWFSRELPDGTTADYIKVSRGEERLFVWCVFRYIMQQVINQNPRFSGIKYIYIDDPMSSLDDNNIILFASQLFELINACHKDVYDTFTATNEKSQLGYPHFIISTHHTVFFNTMRNGLNGCYALKLYKAGAENVKIQPMKEHTPAFYHLHMLALIKKELDNFDNEGICNLQRYHFNVMRGIVEQFAQVFGQRKKGKNAALGYVLDGITFHFNGQEYSKDDEGFERLQENALNILSHTSNTMFEPTTLNKDNIQIMHDIFDHIITKYDIKVPELRS